MKKPIKMFAVFLLGAGAATAHGELTAPAMPTPLTPEDGIQCILYSPTHDAFMGAYKDVWEVNYYLYPNQASRFTLELQDDGSFCMLDADYGYLGENDCLTNSWYHDVAKVTFDAQPGSVYYIHEANREDSQYIGVNEADNSKLYSNCTANLMDCVLLPADSAETKMFMTRNNLYRELVKAEGYYVEPELAVYANPSSTISELQAAINSLTHSNNLASEFKIRSTNEYPIRLSVINGNYGLETISTTIGDDNFTFSRIHPNGDLQLEAVVEVDENSSFIYSVPILYSVNFKVLVDGEEVSKIKIRDAYDIKGTTHRFFIELTPGLHTITFDTANAIEDFYVQKSPLISVNLLEPGSLGTEVLYYVDYIRDVRKLKVTGQMNDDDWAKISMMKYNLSYLDMSDAKTERVPQSQFENWPYIHTVLLPEGVQSIEDNAFKNSQLAITNFPSSLQSIGSEAYRFSNIKSVDLSDSCRSIGSEAFQKCLWLKEVNLSDAITVLPRSTFEFCSNLETCHLPANLEIIDSGCFNNNYNLCLSELPSSLKKIEAFDALKGTNDPDDESRRAKKLVFPKDFTFLGEGTIAHCPYEEIEFPVCFNEFTIAQAMACQESLKLSSPTVVKHNGHCIVEDACRPGVTLKVPSFLVNAYKLDEYWGTFKAVEGFDTDEVDEWIIKDNLVLGSNDRFTNTPSVTIQAKASLKVNGTAGMNLNNLRLCNDLRKPDYSLLINNADDVLVEGDAILSEYLPSQRWCFIALPFDVKVSDVATDTDGALCSMRYYDGANRALNGASGSWKYLGEEDVIPAGTGFIINANKESCWDFTSLDNESKQFLTSNKTFAMPLRANDSENSADKGWNLVGNPYQCYYNTHKLNFTAPITVRNGDNYEAYSLIDDDYALRPNEAFFVQCPDGIEEISFPLDGRQMTSVITDQQGVAPIRPAEAVRTLIDLQLSHSGMTDRTRVVFNDKASYGYETSCDAAKFFSDSASEPQIYSVDAEGIEYAINERPLGDGAVALAFLAGEKGTYTISLERSTTQSVILADKLLGNETDLAKDDYAFTSEAGVFENRFVLYGTHGNGTTGIDGMTTADFRVSAAEGSISMSGANGEVAVYTLSGVKVAYANAQGDISFSVPAGIYLVKAGAKAVKVVVL